MHNPTTSLATLHPDWEVTPIGPQGAQPTIDSGLLTLTPRIDDGSPLVYLFSDNTPLDTNRDFGLVYNLNLALDNNSGIPLNTFIVDVIGDVTDGQGNAAHPGFAHFHPSTVTPRPTSDFNETGYVVRDVSAVPLTNFDTGNRVVLTGNTIDSGTTEVWNEGRVHQYEGSFVMIVTPLVQGEWASAFGVDFTSLPYAFKGQHGNATFSGTTGNDFLLGLDSANTINGLGGHDVIMGTGGNDTLRGEEGVDRLFGGTDNDTLEGGADHDWIEGGHGLDALDGGAGGDRLIGGWHDDRIEGGDGFDTAGYSGVLADYTVRTAADGTTTVAHKGGTEGTDTLTNVEQLKFADQTIDTPPPSPTAPTPTLLSKPPSGVNLITGTDKRETINGTELADGIDGRDGRDTINGLGGDDYIFGATGEDFIDGGDGDDYIRGGNSLDELRGGAGNDEILGDRAADALWGGLGDDTLWGGLHNDVLRGEEGNDTLVGEAGDDDYFGGDGLDLFVTAAAGGNDQIFDFAAGDQILFQGLTSADVSVGTGADPSITRFAWSGGSLEVDSGGLALQEDVDYFFA